MRTNTAAVPSFTVNRPGNNNITFILPTHDGQSTGGPHCTTIVLPEKSTWTPGPHWHERYVEYFRVLKGRVRLVLDGEVRTLTAADGEQRIERFAVHEFMRADMGEDGGGDEGDVVVQEWNEPADGVKEIFFRNAFSGLQDNGGKVTVLFGLQALLIMNTFDNFNVLVEGRFSWWLTHAIWTSGAFVARSLGMRPWYEEYTPDRLRGIARTAGADVGKGKSL